MKSLFTLFLGCFFCAVTVRAQLPPGTTAPNFTVTDLDGNSYTLYDLLDQGKTVYLDFFATWCGPCWNYHNSHAFKDMWETYGPPGTNEVMVFSIEGDASTNNNCLYGPAGCVGGTQGDWVTDTPYPIVESPSVRAMYGVSYYPTIYMICPANKKVYETGQLNMNGLWNFRNNVCPPLSVNMEVQYVQNVNCYGSSTGAIDITASSGNPPYTYNWSNGATSEDLFNVPAGTYSCTVTSSNGWTGETGPIVVEGPAEPISISVSEQTPVGCNGLLGSITVEASGGWWGNYNYAWNNGQQGPSAYGLNQGVYIVTATDISGCTKTLPVTMSPPVYPVAAIAAPPQITCGQPTIQLNAGNSSSGPEYTFQWYVSNGGNIVSGGNSLTPVIDAAGGYSLQVVNVATTCAAFSTVQVTGNTTAPDADAGDAGFVSCVEPSTVLEGSGSSGPGFSYQWLAANGGVIQSGGNTLTPTVGAAGDYTLVVTNAANGCTKSSTTSVSGQNTPPVVAVSDDTLTCSIVSTTLELTTDAGNPVFSWSGPNGYNSSEQSPVVGISGTYSVIVSDTVTGCSNTASAQVTSNTIPPGASAFGGALTCIVDSVAINGASPVDGVSYAWSGPGGFASGLQNPTVGDAGQYSLVVTNPLNGCTSAASAMVLLNNTPPAASAQVSGNLNCNASQIQIDGTGSAQGAGITYLWTTPDGNIVSGNNTLTPTVDAPGTYELQVSNQNTGCTAVVEASVLQSPEVTASADLVENVSCNGGSNGSAAAIAGGGNGAYTYIWSNGGSTSAISNLAAGTYQVTVSDGENCSAVASVVVSQAPVLTANASATPQSANGVDDGTATAAPGGGSPGYTYLWSNGSTAPMIAGLAPGNYTVTVTDANGCTAVQTVTVNAFNCALSASISGTNVSCFGANDGSASVALQGSADPVSYNWSNGATTQAVSDLSPGLYTVEILDGNGCPASLNYTVSEPNLLQANASATPETAAGANDGTAAAIPTGGAGAFTYLWSTGAATPELENLPPGSYTLTVTDQNACTAVQTVVVNAFNCAIDMQQNIAGVSCAGAADGSIALVPAGGEAPFEYIWSNGETTATISALPGGNYTVSVSDANGCLLVIDLPVPEPDPYSAWEFTTTEPDCPNEATGAATAEISGGTMPYTFLWSNGQETNTAVNLTAGNYGVTVTDANGCQSGTTVSVSSSDNQPPQIALQNAELPLNSSGIATVTLSALSAQLSDNCGIATTSILPNSFDCSQLGEHEVLVTVTDLSGLISTAKATVTVVDNTAPVLTCPDNMIRCAEDNVVEFDNPVAVDNCIGGGAWELVAGLESGSEFPTGITTQSYTFTDASGNQGQCSFQIAVAEPVIANVVSVLGDVNNQGLAAIDIDVSGGNAPYTFEWTKDGQVVGDSEDLDGISEGIYTVVITDANGCVEKLEDIQVGNTVAIQEPAWLEGLTIHPNPANQYVRIVFAQTTPDLMVEVINAEGRVVLRNGSQNQASIVLNCANLPEGLYILRFLSDGETGIRKLMVAH
ncbi:MAG: T9SS type A sorting domain-containing protein [Lewinellaceae bacterium]|nr:T9SS type A sorting domain-containing protein [Lewinellaceae bacterium]